jgi:CubicO group peptidase (beta-lactamase class C family)
MSTAGLSKSRLERMHQVLSGHIERKDLPGLVALVSHHDDVHTETLGTLAFGDPAPMKRDTIFRIASLTKPVTAVAAMILVRNVSSGSTIRSTRGCRNWQIAAF